MSEQEPTHLRVFLRAEGRRQNWLAERTGIDEATLSRIVTGRLNPTVAEKEAIARALGTEVASLWPDEKVAA